MIKAKVVDTPTTQKQYGALVQWGKGMPYNPQYFLCDTPEEAVKMVVAYDKILNYLIYEVEVPIVTPQTEVKDEVDQ